MCYAATHPEKMDQQKQVQWQKLAKLQPADMATIINLEHLGVPVRKRGKASGLSFGRKRKRAVRKVRHLPNPLVGQGPGLAGLHALRPASRLKDCCLLWESAVGQSSALDGAAAAATDTVRRLQVQRTS